ncbi:class I SAM-dependent methyltransferase [Brevibacillus sp. HB1.2]|uniref:class I SAM-dependent methyltransferase n=1 Tax=unclassified Brevibacillus TaxID=2684853 RepID=UPI0015751C1F|nr:MULTISPECIES: class I SAM-dependent methyltransferase [unclassified Brevibacillus]NTU21751.1 class I SAM-dependent methyltransferase [Brevibacillus sp. HB1.2]NTU31098.1 class I SAM-dependent methyltransferase [Brevibacillus sp. HB1.1]
MKTYQPLFFDDLHIKLLKQGNYTQILSLISNKESNWERVCFDRLLAIIHDLEVLGLKQQKILDVGCNIGFFSHTLSALGHTVVGIDNNAAPNVQGFYAEPCLDTAQKNNTIYNTDARFIEADIEDYIKNTSDRYDIILLFNVVHHFFNGYAKTGIGKKEDAEIIEILHQFCKHSNRIIYFEGPENEPINYYPDGYNFPRWFVDVAKVNTVTPICFTVGANGFIRNLYRIEI